jgi:uncharacterized protein
MNTKKTAGDRLFAIADVMEDLVRKECDKPENLLDPSFFRFHVELVDRYSSQLCPVFGADPGLVKIASYIHDISAVRDYSTLDEHHLRGADLAFNILKDMISPDENNIIAEAIRQHNVPVLDKSPEAVVLSHADALSKYDSPVFWISYAFKRRFSTLDESVAWYKNILLVTWDMMAPEVRSGAEKNYKAAHEIVSGMERPAR